MFARLSNVATTGERDNEINISELDNYSICQSSDTEELWFQGESDDASGGGGGGGTPVNFG